MNEHNLPDGYLLDEQKKVGERNYTFLYKNEKAILMLPTEHCPPDKIQEVIRQTKD